jgi:hypothetical protein
MDAKQMTLNPLDVPIERMLSSAAPEEDATSGAYCQ